MMKPFSSKLKMVIYLDEKKKMYLFEQHHKDILKSYDV